MRKTIDTLNDVRVCAEQFYEGYQISKEMTLRRADARQAVHLGGEGFCNKNQNVPTLLEMDSGISSRAAHLGCAR